jgi:hypothetical protein
MMGQGVIERVPGIRQSFVQDFFRILKC